MKTISLLFAICLASISAYAQPARINAAQLTKDLRQVLTELPNNFRDLVGLEINTCPGSIKESKSSNLLPSGAVCAFIDDYGDDEVEFTALYGRYTDSKEALDAFKDMRKIMNGITIEGYDFKKNNDTDILGKECDYEVVKNGKRVVVHLHLRHPRERTQPYMLRLKVYYL